MTLGKLRQQALGNLATLAIGPKHLSALSLGRSGFPTRWTGPHYLPCCWDGRLSHRKGLGEHLRHVQSLDEAGGEGAQPEPSLKLEATGTALAARGGQVVMQLPEDACGHHGRGHKGLCQALRLVDCPAGPTRHPHSHCPKQAKGCCPGCQRLKSPAAAAVAAAAAAAVAAAAAYVPYAVSLAGSKTGCGKAQH